MNKLMITRFLDILRVFNGRVESEEARLLPILSGRRGEEKLSPAGLRVLAGIARREGVNLSRLADDLGIAAGSASPLVRQLVHGGLVARKIPNQNRRVINLYLTPAGRAILRLRNETLQKSLKNILSPLKEKDLRHVVSLLDFALTPNKR